MRSTFVGTAICTIRTMVRSSGCCTTATVLTSSLATRLTAVGVRVTGFGAKLSGPSMRCCICSLDTERPDYLDLALRTRDGDQARQYLGAHPECLQSVMAPGFTVEVQEVVIR
jgi:hypothetical protein